MSHAAPGRSWYAWFKAGVFALLACNTGWFAASGMVNAALDGAAWLVLLGLFELETAYGERLTSRRAFAIVRAARLAAAVAIPLAAIGYVREEAWLDAVNSGLWITVVVLLESEVRFPDTVARHRTSFVAIAAALYGSLAVLVPVWAWQQDWLSAFDAALWLVAFATIEMNVLQSARAVSTGPAPRSPASGDGPARARRNGATH